MCFGSNVRLIDLLASTAMLVASAVAVAEEPTHTPTLPAGPDFSDVLSLRSASEPRVSPDGRRVLFTVSSADWEDNTFDAELWLADSGEAPFPLTRTEGGSSTHGRWSPDGSWIAFLADRGDGTQIWIVRVAGGEARPLTAVEDGVVSFEFSPDGGRMAVAVTDPVDRHREQLEHSYGEFAVEDGEFRMTHLWLLDVQAALEDPGRAVIPGREETAPSDSDDRGDNPREGSGSAFQRLTGGTDFTVVGYSWSPDGTAIAFAHAPDPRAESEYERTDISVIDLAAGTVRPLVERPGPDSDPKWSPDGRKIVFATGNGDPAYYVNQELAVVAADGGEPQVITGSFDENPRPVAWQRDGVLFSAIERTSIRLYRVDPSTGAVAPLEIDGAPRIIWSSHVSKNGLTTAFQGEGPDSLSEIYRLDSGAARPERLTRMTEQTAGWAVGSREIVRWQSRDGAPIEGVLLKPEGFDPSTRHPLLVIIHGGPSWVSMPTRVFTYVYPVQQWLAKGAVILMPNYRGSAGYGEDFRSLNVRNLGVGDAWDVMSGVDNLIDLGVVDPDRMGAMGWSQGGYISAFLATTTDRFRAISVGAGISDWMTYYVSTDIHPFTRHYLKGTPWSDPEIYTKTSPMTYINDAVTPTLIQHGELDRRVPLPNAYELYQGLQDMGVPTKLIVYKGFGHGITKPKERLAAVWHNWQWFARWVWGEEVEIPVKEEASE